MKPCIFVCPLSIDVYATTFWQSWLVIWFQWRWVLLGKRQWKHIIDKKCSVHVTDDNIHVDRPLSRSAVLHGITWIIPGYAVSSWTWKWNYLLLRGFGQATAGDVSFLEKKLGPTTPLLCTDKLLCMELWYQYFFCKKVELTVKWRSANEQAVDVVTVHILC